MAVRHECRDCWRSWVDGEPSACVCAERHRSGVGCLFLLIGLSMMGVWFLHRIGVLP